MRFGQNPNKTAVIKPLAPVVVLVITHLPEEYHDYHDERMAVVKHSLKTLRDNAGMDFDWIIWDNGSSAILKDYLCFLTRPSQGAANVILSRNIGKTNALKSIMRMLPAGTILAYGDDDIEYFPNWLAPQIEILQTFPNVGTVTGYPSRLESRWGRQAVHGWVEFDNKHNAYVKVSHATPHLLFDAQLERGRFIPDEWERDYCESHGRNWDTHILNTKHDQDTRITYKGIQAYALGHHCQFVCYPERVEPFIPWTDRAMADEKPIDEAIDAAGFLRLSTVERYTRHIGNVLEKG